MKYFGSIIATLKAILLTKKKLASFMHLVLDICFCKLTVLHSEK